MSDWNRGDIARVGTVRAAALLLWVLLMAAALAAGSTPWISVSLGGAISIGSLESYRLLAGMLVRPERVRRARLWLCLTWVVKWPALWVLLYWAMGTGHVAPEWLCVGLGAVPAAVGVLAARAVVVEIWGGRAAVEGKS